VRLAALAFAVIALVACSNGRFPDVSDAAAEVGGPTCSPDCSSGQVCFSTGPGPNDAGPVYACQLGPGACTSSSSCDCLGPALCGDTYQCAYDSLAGYPVLECVP
jgi:hypothetical protein